MNLLYEDLDDTSISNYSRQLVDPNITFEQYIANIKRGVGERSDSDPNPDPNPNDNPKINSNSSSDNDPDPSPKTMGYDEFEGGTRDDPRNTLKDHPKTSDPDKPLSYTCRVGLSTQHDKSINDNEIIMDTIADSGADIDVITGKHMDSYNNITRLVNATLNGIGGPTRVHEAADHEHLPGLYTNQGIVNNNSDTSCLSISKRASKGWLFWASGGIAQLVTPAKIAYNFILKDGLYRLTKKITEYEGVIFGKRDDSRLLTRILSMMSITP